MPIEVTRDRITITDSPFPLERNLGIAMLGIGTGIEIALVLMALRAEPGTLNTTSLAAMMITVPVFVAIIALILRNRAMTRVTIRHGTDRIEVERIGMFQTQSARLPGTAMHGLSVRERTRDTVDPLYEVVMEVDGLPPLSLAVDASRPAMEAERRRIEWQISGALVSRAPES
ncbi:MAG TPA: hypothetical protein PLJ34_10420 [Hyphomicrobiales bacterium]|nr:hypothetical protein [Kaistiaceae bacterium]HQF31845.1 hypothetical protein [Hyphomicrobiales bacterium]